MAMNLLKFSYDEDIEDHTRQMFKKEFRVNNLIIMPIRSRGHLFTKTNPVRDRRKVSAQL